MLESAPLEQGVYISDAGHLVAVNAAGEAVAIELGVAGMRDLAARLQRHAAILEKGRKAAPIGKGVAYV